MLATQAILHAGKSQGPNWNELEFLIENLPHVILVVFFLFFKTLRNSHIACEFWLHFFLPVPLIVWDVTQSEQLSSFFYWIVRGRNFTIVCSFMWYSKILYEHLICWNTNLKFRINKINKNNLLYLWKKELVNFLAHHSKKLPWMDHSTKNKK